MGSLGGVCRRRDSRRGEYRFSSPARIVKRLRAILRDADTPVRRPQKLMAPRATTVPGRDPRSGTSRGRGQGCHRLVSSSYRSIARISDLRRRGI